MLVPYIFETSSTTVADKKQIQDYSLITIDEYQIRDI